MLAATPSTFTQTSSQVQNGVTLGSTVHLPICARGDTFVVTYLDRLGRNLYETVTTVADLAERDINVQVLDPALDTSRPADKVVVNVMANLAEWERELLVERICEGGGSSRASTGQSGWS